MKTAVEWLVENSHIVPKNELNKRELIKQAKEIEKQQVIKAYDLGSLSDMQYPNPETVIENGEQYYNETFNK